MNVARLHRCWPRLPDVLSEGRLLPAFGVGSGSRDYAATGTPTRGRGQRSAEGLEILPVAGGLGHFRQALPLSEEHRAHAAAAAAWVGGSAPQAIERTAQWGPAGLASSRHESDHGHQGARRRTCPIDEDHYGAGFAFRPAPTSPSSGYAEFLSQRLSASQQRASPLRGDHGAAATLPRNAGVHKFILRPIAQGTEDFIAQTRLLIERVLPEVAGLN